jgi:hypothetical protein
LARLFRRPGEVSQRRRLHDGAVKEAGSAWRDEEIQRIVGADACIDVLKEDDPRQHRVGPVDPLRLLVMLAKVAGGVEKLPRNKGRAEPHVLKCDLASSRLDLAAQLEVTAHIRNIKFDHSAIDNSADPALVERYKFHSLSFCGSLTAAPAPQSPSSALERYRQK